MKTQTKNLKQFRKFRTRAKFQFYVVWRPRLQKAFFPICGLILLIGILKYESEKEYVFTNPKLAAVVAVAEASETNTVSLPVTSGTNDPMVAKLPQTQTSGSSSDIKTSPVRASDVEAKIRKAFPGEENIAVAIAKCESQLDPMRIGDTHMKYPSIGLYQINQTWHKYPTEILQNADENIRIAKEIKERWGNWNAWSCYKFGYYEKHLAQN